MSLTQESPSEDPQDSSILAPHDKTSKPKNKGGKPGWFGWNKYAKKLNEISPSRWSAECLSCHTIWPKGSPQEIEIHLAFDCQEVEPSIRDLFLQ